MRITLSLLLLWFASAGACAQAAHVERIDVVEYGIYTSQIKGSRNVAGVPDGKVNNLSDLRLALTTRTVPAQIGVEFGFRFNIVGTPAGAKVPLRVVGIFPAPGLADPGSGKPVERGGYDRNDDVIGPGAFVNYKLEHEWELVPGVWTFQLWNEGRMLAEQKFTVVKQ